MKFIIFISNWFYKQDGAQKKIPIMLCGNKMDLREEYVQEGKRCVRTEDGQKLARVSTFLLFFLKSIFHER